MCLSLAKVPISFSGIVSVLEGDNCICKLQKSFRAPRTIACAYKNDYEYYQYTQTSDFFFCKNLPMLRVPVRIYQSSSCFISPVNDFFFQICIED